LNELHLRLVAFLRCVTVAYEANRTERAFEPIG
jgi:hypothetical protein